MTYGFSTNIIDLKCPGFEGHAFSIRWRRCVVAKTANARKYM